MTKPRYVNVYKDVKGRFISGTDYETWLEAKMVPCLDRELVLETVRLLSEEEEKELTCAPFLQSLCILLGINENIYLQQFAGKEEKR